MGFTPHSHIGVEVKLYVKSNLLSLTQSERNMFPKENFFLSFYIIKLEMETDIPRLQAQ